MATRKRFSKVGFNKNLIMDVIGASLIVQIAPGLINKVFPIGESLVNLAGAGAGYLVGSLVKRPDLANASIGLGVVGFIAPMVEDLVNGGGGTPLVPSTSGNGTAVMPGAVNMDPVRADLADVFRLNDYISAPLMQVNQAYKNSY